MGVWLRKIIFRQPPTFAILSASMRRLIFLGAQEEELGLAAIIETLEPHPFYRQNLCTLPREISI